MSLPFGYDPDKGTFTSVKPVIELPRNTSVHGSSTATSSYNQVSIWSRFDNFIARIGNWFVEHIDSANAIGSVILIGLVVISALICVISVWNNEGFLLAVLTAIGCCIVGYLCVGIGWYVLLLITNVLMYSLRLIFWNGWTFIVTLCLACSICIFVPFADTIFKRLPSEQIIRTEFTQDNVYRCTANVLNIRKEPNTNSEIIGVLKKGQSIEVSQIQNGFGCIQINGITGYVSMSYLAQ